MEITIEPDGISILNCPGPDRSIPMSAIKKGDILKSRRYRNRRLGDFLKELDLTEGRSTGVPTIQEKLAANGSPRATFETTEDRLTFLIYIPSHTGCGNKPATEKSSEKNASIIAAIKQNSKVSATEIAMQLGISSRAVEKRLKTLRENNIIQRVGGDKGGHWEVIKEPDSKA